MSKRQDERGGMTDKRQVTPERDGKDIREEKQRKINIRRSLSPCAPQQFSAKYLLLSETPFTDSPFSSASNSMPAVAHAKLSCWLCVTLYLRTYCTKVSSVLAYRSSLIFFISFHIINQKLHLQHNCCYTHKASIITQHKSIKYQVFNLGSLSWLSHISDLLRLSLGVSPPWASRAGVRCLKISIESTSLFYLLTISASA